MLEGWIDRHRKPSPCSRLVLSNNPRALLPTAIRPARAQASLEDRRLLVGAGARLPTPMLRLPDGSRPGTEASGDVFQPGISRARPRLATRSQGEEAAVSATRSDRRSTRA
jgi:hypothetical protein